ncbi:MAG: hypothetical protein U5K38_06670 [Woeseiaceae bacterium]|nr:hypothetical protein [Woeseiaceae bacterium]
MFELVQHGPQGCRAQALLDLYGIDASPRSRPMSHVRVDSAVSDFDVALLYGCRQAKLRRFGQDGVEQLGFCGGVHLLALSTSRGHLWMVDGRCLNGELTLPSDYRRHRRKRGTCFARFHWPIVRISDTLSTSTPSSLRTINDTRSDFLGHPTL